MHVGKFCFHFQSLSPLHSHESMFSAIKFICLCFYFFFGPVWQVGVHMLCGYLGICAHPVQT